MKKSQSKKAKAKKPRFDLGNSAAQQTVKYANTAQINPAAKGDLAKGINDAAEGAGLIGGAYSALQGISGAAKGAGTNQHEVALGNFISPSSGVMAAIDDGEWGEAIVSGLLPGLGGQMEAKRNREKLAESNAQQQIITNRALQQNAQAGMAFEKGGTLASNLGVVRGGKLNKISKDAVEVKAHNPTRTDSVELRDAFVDHNEVIDRKNRVFSDTLGFAKKAKALEKQKGTGSRFSASNEKIESQLDDLFKQQEQSKSAKTAASYARLEAGGLLGPPGKKKTNPNGPFSLDEWKGTSGGTANKDRNYKTNPLTVDEIKGWTKEVKARKAAVSEEFYQEDQKKKKKPSKAWGGNMETVGQLGNIIAPTIAAAIARKKLKGSATPMLENRVGLKRVNPNAQLADAGNQFGQAEQVAIRNSGQSSDLISALGNLKSRRVAANNQIQGQTQQINADIANQEANMNVGVGARNAERITAFRQGANDFNNLKQRLTTDNVANLSGKLQMMQAEKNKETLDRDILEVNSWKFNDSGVLDRQKAKLKAENPERYRRLFGQSKGGMIKPSGKKC